MMESIKGKLVIIGGHEDKNGDRQILELVAKDAKKRKGHLVVITAATNEPEALAKAYVKSFTELGVERIEVVDIQEREDGQAEANIQKMDGAAAVFFTGGDQLRITSRIGDTPIYRRLTKIYQQGGTIIGTSAGAAALPATMLINGASDESGDISTLGMAPGLALLPDVVIDTHFAERGRMGRLLGAVAQNPRNLGIGIDENTAIIVQGGKEFIVEGEGAVYVVDGSTVTFSSLSEKEPQGIISIYDVKLHVLRARDCFDLTSRRPLAFEHMEEKPRQASVDGKR